MKPAQRERLIAAMTELAARVGYQAVSIAQLSAHAGVSSATFYEQFDSKEDCFVTAYRSAGERMFSHMGPVLGGAEWSTQGGRRVLGELVDSLRADPDATRILAIESLGGGEQIRRARKQFVSEFERLTQEFIDRAAPVGMIIDIPVVAVTGALRRVVSRRLRINGEDELPSLVTPGLAWLESYVVPLPSGRWSTSPAALRSNPADALTAAPAMPSTLPRGRHGLPPGVVARSQRTRVIYATADVTMRKGFERTTVADIVSQAKVARDVFYEHFADREQAFLEAQHYPTQHILDTCATAYFAARAWPERVWAFLHALINLIFENPAISHLRLVEAYAAGPTAIRRAEEITRSFTFFLEEGYHYSSHTRDLPRLWSHAIAGAIFEIIQRAVARGEAEGLLARLPLLTYIAIAPYTGAPAAIELVTRLAEQATGESDGARRHVGVRV
jgi:AcrR family transcriptional regulator